MPRSAAPAGSRSPIVTATSRASAVALMVSSTSRPPGRSSRHASATTRSRIGDVFEQLTGA